MNLIESQIINLHFMSKLCGDSLDSAIAEKKARKLYNFTGTSPTTKPVTEPREFPKMVFIQGAF